MVQSLQQRQLRYENSYSQNIIPRIPVVLKLDGRSFSKVTKEVNKPFCHKTMAMFTGAMINLCKQIDGVVFGFQYSDKIILILKNDRSEDEDPWFGNDIQKLASITSSMATYEFLNQLWDMNDPPNLQGQISFATQVFAVPNITEAVNYLIYRQFRCMQNAVNSAAHSILYTRYGDEAIEILHGKSMDDRKKIIDDSGFDFDSLPFGFRRGIVSYQIPKLVSTNHGQKTRHKWFLDLEAPLFTDSKDMIKNILTTGSDIFRPERDLDDESN